MTSQYDSLLELYRNLMDHTWSDCFDRWCTATQHDFIDVARDCDNQQRHVLLHAACFSMFTISHDYTPHELDIMAHNLYCATLLVFPVEARLANQDIATTFALLTAISHTYDGSHQHGYTQCTLYRNTIQNHKLYQLNVNRLSALLTDTLHHPNAHNIIAMLTDPINQPLNQMRL